MVRELHKQISYEIRFHENELSTNLKTSHALITMTKFHIEGRVSHTRKRSDMFILKMGVRNLHLSTSENKLNIFLPEKKHTKRHQHDVDQRNINIASPIFYAFH